MRILILAAALPLIACSVHADERSAGGIAASGSGGARSFAVADFTQVDLRGADDVDIRVGTGFSVRAEGPAKELDRLKIARDGDTLRISRENGGFSWGGRQGVKIFVTMPRIAGVGSSGSGHVGIDRVEGRDFTASTAGSGEIDIAALNVRSGHFSVAGSGTIKLAGSVGQLTVDAAGSGNVDAGGLKAAGAKVSVAGSGSVRANVTGAADVSVMGSGDVDLGPRARCTSSKLGSGEVRCGG